MLTENFFSAMTHQMSHFLIYKLTGKDAISFTTSSTVLSVTTSKEGFPVVGVLMLNNSEKIRGAENKYITLRIVERFQEIPRVCKYKIKRFSKFVVTDEEYKR